VEQNQRDIRRFAIGVLVTKDSGLLGGTWTSWRPSVANAAASSSSSAPPSTRPTPSPTSTPCSPPSITQSASIRSPRSQGVPILAFAVSHLDGKAARGRESKTMAQPRLPRLRSWPPLYRPHHSAGTLTDDPALSFQEGATSMNKRLSRRELLQLVGSSGLAAGLGASLGHSPALADPPRPPEGSGFTGSVIKGNVVQSTATCPTVVNGEVIQPQRKLSLLDQTDVLVVGGGSAGVAAAIAARRAGVEVTLVERYNHFGGLWSGACAGRDRAHGQGPQAGLHGNRRGDDAPPREARRRHHRPRTRQQPDRGRRSAQIRHVGHDPGGGRQGLPALLGRRRRDGWRCGPRAVFESKSGRQAILAKNVVDAPATATCSPRRVPSSSTAATTSVWSPGSAVWTRSTGP